MIGPLKPFPVMKHSGVPWMEHVPAHWDTASVKRHYAIQLGKMLQNKADQLGDREVNYLKAQHVQWFAVRTSPAPKMWASPGELDQYGVVSGDLLVCEGGEGGRSGIVKNIPSGYIIQNALHRVRPKSGCSNHFLQYVMSAVSTTGWFDAINNKATIAHFTREKFGSLGIPVPPLPEQLAIVRFLDHADQRIRRYIRAKQKLIKLLEEQKQAIIHRAVTRGLDSNVRLKPSGVEWLGEVPEHWEVKRLKSIARIRYGLGQPPRESQDGLPLIRATNVDRGRILEKNLLRVDPADVPLGRRAFLSEGEIVVVRSGAYTADSAIVPRKYAGAVAGYDMVVTPQGAAPDFLALTFLSSYVRDDQLITASMRSAQPHLNAEELGAALIVVPPMVEQEQIVGHVAAATGHLDEITLTAEREIGLLREYRTRLIADVVTGKLDVREAAASLPEATEEVEFTDQTDILAETEEDQLGDLEAIPEEVDV